jgi:hypothetical protein
MGFVYKGREVPSVMEWNAAEGEYQGMAGDYLVVVDGYVAEALKAEHSVWGDSPEYWLNIALGGQNPGVHYYATGEADPETR